MRTLNDISSLIAEQEHNIVHLEAQLGNLSRQQRILNDSITHHKWQLAQLRSQYSQVARNLNVHSTPIDRLVFILSAGSMGQAWQRATYLRQLSLWRQSRSHMLSQSLARLKQQQAKLQRLSATRRASLNACNNTRAALQSRLDDATSLVVELQGQAPQLSTVLKEKQERAHKLGQSLDRITTSHAVATPSETMPPPLQQGSLQHPVTTRYRIAAPFGRQHHPTLQYVTTLNNGIDIACLDVPAQAVAVEKGVVSALYNQGQGRYIVMVRHGEYLSVYAGLKHPVVKKGQSVARKQSLGEVATDQSSGKPLLHFELRHGCNALDPMQYIERQ